MILKIGRVLLAFLGVYVKQVSGAVVFSVSIVSRLSKLKVRSIEQYYPCTVLVSVFKSACFGVSIDFKLCYQTNFNLHREKRLAIKQTMQPFASVNRKKKKKKKKTKTTLFWSSIFKLQVDPS